MAELDTTFRSHRIQHKRKATCSDSCVATKRMRSIDLCDAMSSLGIGFIGFSDFMAPPAQKNIALDLDLVTGSIEKLTLCDFNSEWCLTCTVAGLHRLGDIWMEDKSAFSDGSSVTDSGCRSLMLADGSRHVAGMTWKIGRFIITAWLGSSHSAASSSALPSASTQTPTVSTKSIASKFISLKAPPPLPPRKKTSSGFKKRKPCRNSAQDGPLSSQLAKQPGIRAHFARLLDGPIRNEHFDEKGL